MKFPLLPIVIAASLSGCQFEADHADATGTFSLAITDTAVTDAENVFLTVSGLTVKGEDGQQHFDFVDENDAAEPQQFDLLSLAGDASLALVDGWELPAGHYDWIRLHVETESDLDSYVVLDGGATHELTIPSGDFKLVSGFDVPAGGSAEFTVDVDLNKGLVLSNGGYKLKPVMRLLDNTEAGHIAGTVDANIYTDSSCTDIAVYAFTGTDTAANDIFDETGPILVAFVDELQAYELGFLSAGDYTLHLACDPIDDPEVDDAVVFVSGQSQNVTVEADTTTMVNFTL